MTPLSKPSHARRWSQSGGEDEGVVRRRQRVVGEEDEGLLPTAHRVLLESSVPTPVGTTQKGRMPLPNGVSSFEAENEHDFERRPQVEFTAIQAAISTGNSYTLKTNSIEPSGCPKVHPIQLTLEHQGSQLPAGRGVTRSLSTSSSVFGVWHMHPDSNFD